MTAWGVCSGGSPPLGVAVSLHFRASLILAQLADLIRKKLQHVKSPDRTLTGNIWHWQVAWRTSWLLSISPGKTDRRIQESGYLCVCVFVCVCLFFSCYTVITITLWGVDLMLGFDLSGHVPGSSTSQTGNVLWWNDHLLMSNLCKIVLSAF